MDRITGFGPVDLGSIPSKPVIKIMNQQRW